MRRTDLPWPPEDEYLNCSRCGLCLSVCPTYREYLSETSSPRGRVALARKGLQKELELNPNLIEQMYACFDCLACNQICPVGIHPASLALAMRSIEEQQHPSAWKKVVFENLLNRPEQIDLASWPLRLYRTIGERFGAKLGDLAAMLPPLPQQSLRQTLPAVSPAIGESRYKVGFFIGCAQNLIFADDSAACVRVLTANHCSVLTPKQAVCCGMPARGYGRQDLLLEHARRNIEIFEKSNVDTIITDCATCGSTLKDYGDLFSDDREWAAKAAAFSSKVRDISEFLATIPLEKPAVPIKARITYHDPCHLGRGQGVKDQPRQLLKMIEGIEFVELPESDWCCGSAGSQLITHYETSLKVLNRKMENFKHTQAEIIATGCPGCQMQLNVGARKHGLDVQVTHPIRLLDQAYGYRGNGHGQ
jgi:glycolate oxidase iron-sulfur subunit